MEIGDKVIWDSNFGYEVGYFLSDSNAYFQYSVDIISGKYKGEASVSQTSLKPYSLELVEELTKKYGYLKTF
jgi:hypothetical protein